MGGGLDHVQNLYIAAVSVLPKLGCGAAASRSERFNEIGIDFMVLAWRTLLYYLSPYSIIGAGSVSENAH